MEQIAHENGTSPTLERRSVEAEAVHGAADGSTEEERKRIA
jgi:hypothetical protein